MHRFLFLFCCLHSGCLHDPPDGALKQYRAQAARVTIIRDEWGIPHVYGKTDADAVFGIMFAQCEESFERVEHNYIQRLGRLAEVEGPARLLGDLKMRLIYDTTAAKAAYSSSPPWLLKLLDAFAAGINYYLYKHPETRPLLLTNFEPWYPLLMPDGAYISTLDGGLDKADLEEMYGSKNLSGAGNLLRRSMKETHNNGSNAFAIGPKKSGSGSAMLFINPHVTFDFRMEAQMVSEEGLNAYGAITWGQFFVFQGFNENCGWMHTSSMADAADLYVEKIIRKDSSIFYEYNGLVEPIGIKQLSLRYNQDGSRLHNYTTYFTRHGPIVGSRSGNWLSLKQRGGYTEPLIQSWLRTKSVDLAAFQTTMHIRANSSTNTMYADNKGNIAYWHGNFIPKRNPAYNWQLPVPGNLKATDWKEAHEPGELVQFLNPVSGWLQNCNSDPFSAAGAVILDRNSFPGYMAPEGENFRSLYAISQFTKAGKLSLDSLTRLGTSTYLAAFDSLLPPLLNDYNSLNPTDPQSIQLREPVSLLKSWDRRSTVKSVATSLAIMWAYTLLSNPDIKQPASGANSNNQVAIFTGIVKNTPSAKRLDMLRSVVSGLQRAYGSWHVPWGNINRFQKQGAGLYPQFNDQLRSDPVGFASALFGSLPSYETEWTSTGKGYGVAGNSFSAVVEFGSRIKAKSIMPGGQSFNKTGSHFSDQTALYLEGKFKDVYFYKNDVLKNKERSYHPGE